MTGLANLVYIVVALYFISAVCLTPFFMGASVARRRGLPVRDTGWHMTLTVVGWGAVVWLLVGVATYL